MTTQIAESEPEVPVEEKGATGSWLARSRILEFDALPLLLAMAAVAIAFQIQSPYFLTARNLGNLALEVAPLVMLALGEVVVILMKEIDLSLGSIAGVSAAICASLLTNHHYSWWSACLLTLALAGLMGGVQGGIVVFGSVASFVVTLGGYLVFLGLQLQLLGPGGGINIVNPTVIGLTNSDISVGVTAVVLGVPWAIWLISRLWLWRREDLTAGDLAWEAVRGLCTGVVIVVTLLVFNSFGGVPVAVVVVVGVVGAVASFLKHAPSGRHLYSIGGNTEATRRAGVRVRTIRVFGFAFAGMAAAVGGILYLSAQQGAGTVTGGGATLLSAIGAAVVGGVSLFGGRGSAWGALFGALVLTGVQNGLDLTNHSASTQYVVQGIVVVAAVLLDSVVRQRLRAGGGRFTIPTPGMRR